MRLHNFPLRMHRTFMPLFGGSVVAAAVLFAQTQNPPAGQNPPQAGTIRVKVGLVQTDIMVFDKQGHFVPDLKMEQFEFRVDGKVQPLPFLEMVSAGSPHDEFGGGDNCRGPRRNHDLHFGCPWPGCWPAGCKNKDGSRLKRRPGA